MKDAEQVFPVREITIGGEKVQIKCNYRTIYNYEKDTGRGLALITRGELGKMTTTVDFLHAAIGHLNEKYTKEWIVDNLTKDLIKEVNFKVIVETIAAAFGEGEEKKTQEAEAPSQQQS